MNDRERTSHHHSTKKRDSPDTAQEIEAWRKVLSGDFSPEFIQAFIQEHFPEHCHFEWIRNILASQMQLILQRLRRDPLSQDLNDIELKNLVKNGMHEGIKKDLEGAMSSSGVTPEVLDKGLDKAEEKIGLRFTKTDREHLKDHFKRYYQKSLLKIVEEIQLK